MKLLSLPLALSPLFVAVAHADTAVEFDPTMLMNLPNQPAIDITRFNQSGVINAGKYRLDIYVNDGYKGLSDVRYLDDSSHPTQNAKLCVDDELLAKLDIKPATQQIISKQANGCYDLSALAHHRTELDMSAMRLNVNIPQAYLIDRPHDYTDPISWDKGVNSAFISYQFNHHQTDNNNNKTTDNYLGLNTGVNVGRWHFRHQGFARDDNQQSTHYQALNTFAYTDIPSLQSQLVLGDFYADGALFDSNAMRGLQIMSDDRMLPASMQGFAPIIHGIANSNAKVSIFQNNQEIYSTTVPAGAFELTNVRDIGSSGDLTVVITEADGQQTRQILPYHSAISLLRPKRHRHAYAFGRIRHHNTHLHDDHVLQGTWQQGLTNRWTLNTGVQYSPHYHALLLGSSFSTMLGAFSVNAIGSKYTLYNKPTQHGHQLRLQYHRLIAPTKTNIHASIRYYHDDESMENVLRSHDDRQTSEQFWPKYRYQLSVSQPLGKDWGSLHGFFSRTEDKNNRKQDQWQLGYSHRFGRLSYGISAQTTKTDNNKSDRQYLLNLSMPLGVDSHHHVNAFVTRTSHDTQYQTGISGRLKDLPHFDYGINASHNDSDHQLSWSANANYQTPVSRLNASISDYANGRQYSLGASGALVAHKGGITSTNQLGETFAIVHLPHGKGASLDVSDNVKFNKNGYAILSNLSPYRLNHLTINPQGLPFDVQLENTGSQVTPIAGASVLVKFDSTIGKLALLTIKLADGTYPPMGVAVHNQEGTAVGFVAQDGRVFLQNAQDNEVLTLKTEKYICTLNYRLPTSASTPISHINAICQ